MKVAITGASGFIGRALCAAASAAGHEVLPLDLRSLGGRIALQGAAALVHLAAIAHRRRVDPADLHRVNVELSESIGRAAANAGVPLVFVSSVHVHGEETRAPLREDSPLAPQDAYAASKAKAEAALRSIPGLRLVVLRPPLVYGPAVKANFLLLLMAAARGLPLPLANVVNRRSLLYVGNLVDAILRCITQQGALGRTFLISDGAPVSTPELYRKLAAALGRPARLFPFPLQALELVPSMRKLTRSLEIDDALVRNELAWRPPFSFEEGLQATAEWYRAR